MIRSLGLLELRAKKLVASKMTELTESVTIRLSGDSHPGIILGYLTTHPGMLGLSTPTDKVTEEQIDAR